MQSNIVQNFLAATVLGAFATCFMVWAGNILFLHPLYALNPPVTIKSSWVAKYAS